MRNSEVSGTAQPSTHHQTNPAVWDKDMLIRRVKGRERRIHQALTAFLNQKEAWITTIEENIQSISFEKLTKLSSSIKRTAGNLSCHTLLKIAKRTEQAAIGRETDELQKLLPQLQIALEDVSNYFSKYLALSA